MKSRYYLALCLFLAACGSPSSTEQIPDREEPRAPIGQPVVMPRLPGDVSSHPSQGTVEQSRGFYSKGKLTRATSLPTSGKGITKILRPRARHYGSRDLIYVLTTAAKELQRLHPSRDRVQVGDMSNKKGGFAYGHDSHQNGLDADLAFLRTNQTEQDPQSVNGFAESFVKDGKPTANFDTARNWALAKLLIATGRVQRIFVNDVLKQELCRFAEAKGEFEAHRDVLYRLRSYEGHMDHYHVRLTCPLKSPKCEAQEEPPETTTGCQNRP